MSGATDPRDVLRRALIEIRSLKERLAAAEATPVKPEPVAVVGIGCRFPGGSDTPEAFWQMMSDGRDAVAPRPPGRWTDAGEPREGGFLADVEGFDARFFGIAPREAAAMDPQHRLLLEVAWEALEHASIDPHALAGSRTGVFVGLATNDFARRVPEDAVDRYFGVGSSPAVASGRLAYLLDLRGPCLTLDTACSSSLVAVHYAMRALRDRDCDLGLAGGVSLMLAPSLGRSFVSAGMLAPDGRCKTFDAQADGYGRAEGAGVVVLKRLADALRDGDPVLAVLRGSAVNQDGRSAGLTAPNGPAQAALIRSALDASGLTPADIDYVEAHGTGTPLGDPIEWHALAAAFAGRTHKLLVGSVKSNIGHAEAAAGIAGLIKAVLAVARGVVPPNLHFARRNPAISMGPTPIEVPVAPRSGVRRAGVSAFGFSGTNAHVIVEAPPERAWPAAAGEGVLFLSAPDPIALQALARQFQVAFAAGLPFGDACHTAAVGRARFPWWIAVRAPADLATAQPSDGPPPVIAATRGRRVVLPTYPFQRERFPLPGGAPAERTVEPDDPLLAGAGGLAHLGVLLTLLGEPAANLESLTFPAPLVFATPRLVRVERDGRRIALQSRIATDPDWTTHLAASLAGPGMAAREPGTPPAELQNSCPGVREILAHPAEPSGRQPPAADAPRVLVPAEERSGRQLPGPDARRVAPAGETLEPPPPDIRADGSASAAGRREASGHHARDGATPPMRGPFVPAAGLYDRIAAAGFTYGDAARRLQSVAVDGTDVAARLVPDAGPDLSPGAIEAAAQLAYALLPEGAPPVMLAGADRLARFPGGPAATAWLRRTAATPEGGVRADFGLCDAAGRMLLRVEGASLAPLPDQARRWSRVVTWLPAPRPTPPFASQAAGLPEPFVWHAPVATPAEVCAALLHVLASVGERSLRIVTRGAQHTGTEAAPPDLGQAAAWGMALAIMAERPALRCRLIDLDPAATTGVPPGELDAADELAIAWRGTRRLARRLTAPSRPAPAAETATLPAPGVLRWEPRSPRQPGPGMVRIGVVAAGLTFRDRLLFNGLAPPGSPLGSDCAGVVEAVGPGVPELREGDRVIALAPEPLSDCVMVASSEVAPAPCADLVAAASMPVPYLTALAGLPPLGPDDCVLIHQAGSATGLAAAELARRAGARVVLTAGRHRHEWFAPIPMLDSREPATWATEIWAPNTGAHAAGAHASKPHGPGGYGRGGHSAEAHGPKGHGPEGHGPESHGPEGHGPEGHGPESHDREGHGPEACAAASGSRPSLADAGVTVAFGAFEPAHLAQLAGVRVVNLDKRAADHFDLDRIDPARRQELLRRLADLPPLPRRVVPRGELASALAAEGPLVGRMVVLMRPPPPIRIERGATYLVTGAAGALGRLVAEWLAAAGGVVCHVDRAPMDVAAPHRAVRADAGDEIAMASLLQALAPGVRGVFHCAGIVDDDRLEQQTAARLETVLAAKVNGAMVLDRLTRGLRLDHFVLFSSIVGLLPSARQAGYAAANAVLDQIAQARQQRGLPGLSLAWGPWHAGIGRAMGARAAEAWHGFGVTPILPAAGLRALPTLLASPEPCVAVADMDWDRAAKPTAEPAARPDPGPVTVERLQSVLAPLLGVRDPATLDPEAPLLSFGLDSLTAVEFARALSRELARPVAPDFVYNHPTLTQAAQALAARVLAARMPTAQVLPAGVPAAQVLPAQMLAAPVLAAPVLAAPVLAAPVLAAPVLAAQSPATRRLAASPATAAFALHAPRWEPAPAARHRPRGWTVAGQCTAAVELRRTLAADPANLADLSALDVDASGDPAARQALFPPFLDRLRTRLGLPTRVVVVVPGAGALAGAVEGFATAIAAEQPAWTVRVVRWDGTGGVAALLRELEAFDPEPRVRLGLDGRQVLRLGCVARAERWHPSEDATYLVTGASGGIGSLVASHLVARGARHLVLAARRPVLPPDLVGGAGEIRLYPVDLADEAAVARLLETVRPGLRGIFHAAGVTANGTLAASDWNRMGRAFPAKADGARLLDRLSRALPLSKFVLFSSTTAWFGLPGTAGYAAANGFLDGLAEERRAAGLPGLSIGWCAWQGVGMAADPALWQGGRAPSLPPASALAALDAVLAGPADAASVVVTEPGWHAEALQAALGSLAVGVGT